MSWEQVDNLFRVSNTSLIFSQSTPSTQCLTDSPPPRPSPPRPSPPRPPLSPPPLASHRSLRVCAIYTGHEITISSSLSAYNYLQTGFLIRFACLVSPKRFFSFSHHVWFLVIQGMLIWSQGLLGLDSVIFLTETPNYPIIKASLQLIFFHNILSNNWLRTKLN